MNDFFQGIIACVGMLGGICGFNYWMFLVMEKRIDTKLDVVVNDVHSLAVNVSKLTMRMDEQSKRTDQLYDIFIQKTDKLYEVFSEKMDQQSKRTDQLYEICIDLIKDKKAPKEKK